MYIHYKVLISLIKPFLMQPLAVLSLHAKPKGKRLYSFKLSIDALAEFITALTMKAHIGWQTCVVLKTICTGNRATFVIIFNCSRRGVEF